MTAETRREDRKYRRETLSPIFDSVADPLDWRAPISTWIKPEDLNLVRDAVAYFAGTDVEVEIQNKTDHPAGQLGHTMLIYSVGYRNGPCGP